VAFAAGFFFHKLKKGDFKHYLNRDSLLFSTGLLINRGLFHSFRRLFHTFFFELLIFSILPNSGILPSDFVKSSLACGFLLKFYKKQNELIREYLVDLYSKVQIPPFHSFTF